MSMKVSTPECNNAGDENFSETGPRPPALGEEEHDVHSSIKSSTSNHSGTSSKSNGGMTTEPIHVASGTPRKSVLESKGIAGMPINCIEGMVSLKLANIDDPPLGYEPEGSANTTPPFTEASTPPAYLKWAENLRNLLEDEDGVQLFRNFLRQEQCQDSLDFWFACEGLKNKSPDSEPEIQQIIRIIYRKYVRSCNGLAIAHETRQGILEKVQTKFGVDQRIFDRAQLEVEASISSTTYPNFLKSDIYLQFVQSIQNGGADSPKLSDSGGGSGSSSTSGGGRPSLGFLPTVDENKELQVATNPPVASSSLPLTHHHLVLTQQRRAGYSNVHRKSEAHAGHYLQHGMVPPVTNPYHAIYASCVPVSAQDSELQSLSSDAHTDDTVSLTDGSVDGIPVYSTKKYLRQQHHVMRQNASQNRELDPNHNFIPRLLRLPQEQMTPMEPAKFAAMLSEKLEVVLKDRETQEKLHDRLHKFQEGEDATTVVPPKQDDHLLLALPAGSVIKMPITDEHDHQSILDDHVNRLWNDCTDQPSPRHRSPERRRASAPPAPSFQALHPKVSPAYPGSHHRHRRDRDVVSTFSSDSGMVRDYAEPDYQSLPTLLPQQLPPGSVTPAHHKYTHHHGGAAKTKSLPKSPSTVVSDQVELGGRTGFPQEPYCVSEGNLDRERRSKDGSRRSSSKKTSADSSSSCVDSGVSTVYDPPLPPGVNSNERVMYWMLGNEKYSGSHHTDSEKDSSTRHRKSSHSSLSTTSPSSARQGRVKKPVVYNTSRSGSLERGSMIPWIQPSQPFASDPSMPMLPPPNTTTQLEEARRRLEDDTKAKLNRSKLGPPSKDKVPHVDAPRARSSAGKGTYLTEIQEEANSTLKRGKRSTPVAVSAQPAPPSVSDNEYTIVGYYFCGDRVPFKTHLPGTNITLRQFKTLINTKKGNFRFFFKKASDEFGTGVVNEEISDDNQVLPLWDGKIFALVESVD